jgi:RHS repeat-associated protein
MLNKSKAAVRTFLNKNTWIKLFLILSCTAYGTSSAFAAAGSISSTPITTTTVGQVYEYVLSCNDSSFPYTSATYNCETITLQNAPSGMKVVTTGNVSLGNTKNTVTFTAKKGQVGTHTVKIRNTYSVNPFQTSYTQQTYTLTVQNRKPAISSSPVTKGYFEQQYTYQVQASDADGHSLSFSLIQKPAGMTISSTGLISWVPDSYGAFPVEVKVDDGYGKSDSQSFVINVVNTEPVISSTPTTTAYLLEPYTYQIVAQDADGHSLNYSLIESVENMSISATGLLTWAAPALGVQNVSLLVSDGFGGAASQSFTLQTYSAQYTGSDVAGLFEIDDTVNPETVGDISGELSVSQDGSAFYTVPISISPGTAGMEPTLSLTYNSHGSNGVLGMGWTLGGLSAISRCGSTLAEDGVKRSIELNSNDHLCLEGERLVQSGTGSDAVGSYTEYRKVMDASTRIRGYGSANGQPEHFLVWTKAGQLFSYGETSDSRSTPADNTKTVTWGVNKIEDSVGNYLTVSYINDATNGDFRPNRIDYTGNDAANLSPYNSVRFSYEARSDKSQLLIAGQSQKVMKRMTAIQAYAGSSLVHEYKMVYEQSPNSGVSLLKSVTECAESVCFNPLTFDWQYAAGDLQFSGADNKSISGNLIRTGDVNGDGLQDLLSLDIPVTASTSQATSKVVTFYLRLGTQNGFSASQNVGSVTIACGQESYSNSHPYTKATCVPIDFELGDVNGDGRADLTYVKGEGLKSYDVKAYLRLSNGNGFGSATTIGNFSRPCKVDTSVPGPGTIEKCDTYKAGMGDVNGDGKADLIYTVPTAYNSGSISVKLIPSNGQGYGVSLEAGTINRRCVLTDPMQQTYECYPYTFDLGDVDGDGRMDLVSSKTDIHEFRVSVRLSTGTDFATAKDYDSPRVGGIWLGDINGDGLADMVSYESPYAYEPSNKIFMQLSERDSFSSIAELGPFSTLLPSGDVADLNHDGLADFVSAGEHGYLDKARIRSASAPTNDLLTRITSSLGVSTSINYSRLTDSAVYTQGAAESYPQQTLNKNALIDVVASIDNANGLGGTNTTSYHYTHGINDLEGRGFLGFAKMTTTESVSGIKTVTSYSQTYPYTGQVLSSVTQVPVGGSYTTVSELENTMAVKSLFNGDVVLPYVAQNDQAQYELDGELITYARTIYTIDDYGNNTAIFVETAGTTPDTMEGEYDPFTTHTLNTYVNDTNNWYLGRLSRVDNTQTSPNGASGTRSSAFEYDAITGLLTKEIVEPDNAAFTLVTTYGHDVYGNQTSTTVSGNDIESRTTTTVWGERNSSNFGVVIDNGRFAVTNQNALGHTEQMAYDTRFGKVTQLRGPNGLDTVWSYDNFGRVLKETRADGSVEAILRAWCSSETCPSNGLTKTLTLRSGTVPSVEVSDRYGRGISGATVGRNGQVIYTETEYNARGEVARKSRPYFSGDAALWHDFVYDEMGRLISETAADGSETLTGYDGLVTTVTNAVSQPNARYKNVRGDVVQVYDADGNDIFYRYDAFGNLIETEDADGNLIQNSYDVRGRKIAMNDPDMGNWTYEYNVLGELISQTDAKGQTVTFTYDKLGRMVSRTEPEGTSTWSYDTASNGIGKIAQTVGSEGEVKTYQYDSLGRASSVTTLVDNQSFTVSTSYDSLSRVSTITYPPSQRYATGLVVGYTYTQAATDGADGYLKTVTNQSDATLYWQATAQDAEGHLTEWALGNGITSEYNYNAQTGLVSSIQSRTSGATNDIQFLGFAFDAIGNLTSRTDYNQKVGTGLSDWLIEDFQYDNLNRMTQSQVAGQTAKTYNYDALGNITFKTGVGSYSYGNNAGPHAVTQVDNNGVLTDYIYDANGNMTSGADRAIGYTSFNKPNSITTATASIQFHYDADRSRIKRENLTTGKVRYYIGDLFEQEEHNQITTYTHFIKAAGSIIAIETSKSNQEASTHYLHKDHLGSVSTITDQNGLVVEEQSYDAHGKRRNSDWTDIAGTPAPSATTDRGFTGHEHIDEVGLVHMNGRVYDPTLGRFISADPHIQAPLNSQSLNRYSYVMNNPLSFTDPSGFFFGSLFKSLFKAIGSIFKGVVSLIKSILQNKVLRTIAAIAITFIPGGQGYGFAMLKGFAAGYVGSGGDLRAGIVGALTAGAFHGVGEHYARMETYGKTTNYVTNTSTTYNGLTTAQRVSKAVSHGVVGGASAKLNGGNFSNGFWSAGVAQGFSKVIDGIQGGAQRVVVAATVGGTTSVLGGGKFASGALTGAFSRAFNDESEKSWPETFLDKSKNILTGLKQFFGVGGTDAIGVGVAGKIGGTVYGAGLQALNVDLANNAAIGVLRFKLDKAYEQNSISLETYAALRQDLGTDPFKVVEALKNINRRRENESMD